MTTNVVTAGKDMVLTDVIALLLRWHISALLVVDENHTLMGIVSEIDLVNVTLDGNARDTTVAEVMATDIISFGPDGVYGHYDHLAVHRWATAAVQLSSEADCWPEAGPMHPIAKFYHRALPEEQVAQLEQAIGRNYVPMDGVPFPFVGYPMEKITTIIDVRDYAETKVKGIRCHASQLAPDNPYTQADFDVTANPLFWQEMFILAQCQPEIQSAP